MTDQNEAARRVMDEDSVALRLLAKHAEIERLRELLRECQPYVEAGLSMCDTRLCDAVEKEVGDE